MGKKALFAVIAGLLILSACGKEPAEVPETETVPVTEPVTTKAPETEAVIEIECETEEETETAAQAEEEEDLPPEEGMRRSLLTNEWIPEELFSQRPVAVMYPTDKKAQPQYGLSNVSVFYEILEEGSMSRQMGVIEDYDGMSRIGNVRSIRDYFIYEALEWDSIIVHFGGPETFVKDFLTRPDVDNLNGVDGVMGGSYGAFYRYPANVNSTHNAYTDSEHLKKAIEKAGFETEHRADYWSEDRAAHWKFAKETHPVDLSGRSDALPAEEISMKGIYPITGSQFQYNAEDGKYYRFIYGEPQKDALTGEQMSFDNILVEACASGSRGQGYLWFHVLDGGHFGWYMTRGKMIPVRWQKTNEYEATRFFDGNGEEITLNTGKTMVCIAREGMDSFEADGTKYDL